MISRSVTRFVFLAYGQAKADADTLMAEAQRIHGEAQQTKAAADTALTAANAKQGQADTAFEVASRLAEEHETARLAYQGKVERLNAFMQAESIVGVPTVAAPLVSRGTSPGLAFLLGLARLRPRRRGD